MQGKKQRLTTPRVRITGEARFADRRIDGQIELRSGALALNAKGVVDLATSSFDPLRLDANLLRPEALFPNMSGRSIRMQAVLDGPFATARFRYHATAPHFAFDDTGFDQASADGAGRLSRGLVLVPIRFRAARVTGIGDVAGGILADEASSTLARLRALAALREAAETDPLTGLLNRRSFAAGLARLPPDSALVMLDLDHFKRVNDEGGHHAGDQVLKSFSAHLRAAARSEDLVARWGGEEFAVALPAGAAEGAASLLARVRESWEGATPTFSAGYTVVNPSETAAAALDRADTALYHAKAAGRDQDTFAPIVRVTKTS